MLHGRLLKYLDEVVRSGSIRKASARLNVAASAINRQLIELEQEIGAPIFERMPKGLRLTTAGEILIGHVRETLRDHERTIGQITALKGLLRGEVTIATMGGLASGILADALLSFRLAHPRVKLIIRVIPRDGIIAAVLAGEVDLGLAYNLPVHPRITRASVYDHHLGAVVAPDHPLAGRDVIRMADCLSFPLVVADRSMSLRDSLEMLVPPTADLTPLIETNSLEMMKVFAAKAPHVTFLNRADVVTETRAGTLAFVPFAGTTGRQKVVLVHRAKGAPDPVASMVARFIDLAFQEREGQM